MWYSRGNFLSLLNLPDQIKQFGSIRFYWEGTCERYIQYVKPLMTNMRNTPTYLAKQFHTLQQKNMMDHIMETVPNSDLNLKKYTRYNDMKIYSDVASVAEILQESEVFMCVYDTPQHELDQEHHTHGRSLLSGNACASAGTGKQTQASEGQ